MQILQQVASLDDTEITHAITEISNKKQRKFGRKRWLPYYLSRFTIYNASKKRPLID